MRFPWTLLACVCLPFWLAKRSALFLHRFRIERSTIYRWADEVDPSLVVGGALFSGDLAKLEGRGVRAILNLCAEYLERRDDLEACAARDIATHHLPLIDDWDPDVPALEKGVAWIDARVAEGRKVYVHCAAGRGRSVSIVLAWLVARRGLTTDEALARVKSVRKLAGPRARQLRAVRDFEHRLKSSSQKDLARS